VFLLSGIGAMLAVLTNRLSRIIDRGRTLETRLAASPPDLAAHIRAELATLSHRAQLISRAITLCTVTAMLVCTVIATLFLAAFASFDASCPWPCSRRRHGRVLRGLLFFLREIFVARRTCGSVPVIHRSRRARTFRHVPDQSGTRPAVPMHRLGARVQPT